MNLILKLCTLAFACVYVIRAADTPIEVTEYPHRSIIVSDVVADGATWAEDCECGDMHAITLPLRLQASDHQTLMDMLIAAVEQHMSLKIDHNSVMISVPCLDILNDLISPRSRGWRDEDTWNQAFTDYVRAATGKKTDTLLEKLNFTNNIDNEDFIGIYFNTQAIEQEDVPLVVNAVSVPEATRSIEPSIMLNGYFPRNIVISEWVVNGLLQPQFFCNMGSLEAAPIICVVKFLLSVQASDHKTLVEQISDNVIRFKDPMADPNSFRLDILAEDNIKESINNLALSFSGRLRVQDTAEVVADFSVLSTLKGVAADIILSLLGPIFNPIQPNISLRISYDTLNNANLDYADCSSIAPFSTDELESDDEGSFEGETVRCEISE